MKLVHWDDDCVPGVIPLPNGDGLVADCAWFYNLQVGDQIQYHTEIGTSCYFVIDKQPATPDSGLGEGVYHVVIRTPSLIEGVIFT